MGRAQKFSDIRDGLSNTLCLSEVRVRANQQDQRGAWALPWTGSSLLAFDMHERDHDVNNPPVLLDNFVPWSASFGQTQPPNNQGPNVDMLYNCSEVANAQLTRMPCATYDNGMMHYLSAAPRSNHDGGVYIFMLDGSTKFLRNDVDEVTMCYMISIHDNQPISFHEDTR